MLRWTEFKEGSDYRTVDVGHVSRQRSVIDLTTVSRDPPSTLRYNHFESLSVVVPVEDFYQDFFGIKRKDKRFTVDIYLKMSLPDVKLKFRVAYVNYYCLLSSLKSPLESTISASRDFHQIYVNGKHVG